MHSLSRRGFIVLGGTGAAGIALASCGEEVDPRAEGRDDELLTAALSAEMGLQSAYAGGGLAGITPTNPITDTQDERVARLEDLGATAASSDAAAAGDVIAASDAAIAAYRELAGIGSTIEIRSAATQGLAEIAAVLAAARLEAGDDPAPDAFVTGGVDPPYEPEVADVDAEKTTSTTSTTEEAETTSTQAGG